MLNFGLRALLGLLGALAVLTAARLWMDPSTVGAVMGLAGHGPLGLATLRADVGGFFAAAGLFSAAAAWRNNARLLTAPLAMIALALCGRLLAAAVDGLEPRATPSIAIEAAIVVVLAAGRFRLAVR